MLYVYILNSTVMYIQYVEQSCVEWRMRMLFTLLLTALTATSGEDTHTTVRGRDTLHPSGPAGSGSQEEVASLTWTGGHTTGEGERERDITTGLTCQSLTERREPERQTKGGTTASTQRS